MNKKMTVMWSKSKYCNGVTEQEREAFSEMEIWVVNFWVNMLCKLVASCSVSGKQPASIFRRQIYPKYRQQLT